jgi:hypothetical protein
MIQAKKYFFKRQVKLELSFKRRDKRKSEELFNLIWLNLLINKKVMMEQEFMLRESLKDLQVNQAKLNFN